jgi:hypothetical protein
MADILLVDFGTSRVKSVVASLDSLKVLNEAQIASPDPRFGPAGLRQHSDRILGEIDDGRSRP